MNTGENPVFSQNGLVTTIAWGLDGKVNYALEGSVFVAGAVVQWLRDELRIIDSAEDSEYMASKVKDTNGCYVVPAFTGLGAPYWDSKATGILCGITRTTNQAEVARAALDCIAYQITDILKAMEDDSGISIQELRVDGGPTKNKYLMQFQSDIAGIPVKVPASEELSGIGAAYAAGIGLGIYDREALFSKQQRTTYEPEMGQKEVDIKYKGWKEAVGLVLKKS